MYGEPNMLEGLIVIGSVIGGVVALMLTIYVYVAIISMAKSLRTINEILARREVRELKDRARAAQGL